jgi:hypothetical protein
LTTAACSAFNDTTLPPGAYGSSLTEMTGSTNGARPVMSRQGRDYYEEVPSWWPG